ncbi:hypothetical protein PUR71_10835 [Streptomyces sp. SP17BM10]|uniref:hypothetical protein n=1 Tax=Streptomyces sp. SP17BM10 TaxID=3002530 RepID=UPI002E795170|nr:hypothetical protein [Streptomyces sp. SP17BM10]MEE1783406.1 hypothetical protein [Streptomyces sp. SP17BM10]
MTNAPKPGVSGPRAAQLIDWVNRVERSQDGVRAVVRALSHVLEEKRGGRTSDGAPLFLIEWR